MNNYILEVKNLTKLFYPLLTLTDLAKLNFRKKPPVRALDDISFSLPQGKILGILGPNGAGKTTLLKIISTLILSDKGKVSVAGYTPGKDDKEIKSLIGLMSCEERSFYWRLSGLQNLQFFATMHGLNKNQARSKIQNFFKIFKINYADKRFDTYSTGMKRKFSLIRALFHEPDLLLLDEPTKSLDYNTALELRGFIKNLAAQGKTILFATHNLEEAENLCDNFMILDKGKIFGFGSLENLRKKIQSPSATLAEIYLKLTENVQ